jgi:hypothetical protein
LQHPPLVGNHFIESKLPGMNGGTALSVPLVIDIRAASTQSGAVVQDFSQNSTNDSASDTANQVWEFTPDPAGSGFYFIKSKDGRYLVTPSVSENVPLTANSSYSPPAQALWRFVNDPAGSGYFFIQNQWNGCVIDIQGASTQRGTALVTFPMKLSGTANQLWKAPFPSPVWLPSSITFSNKGTGSGTALGGGNECAFNMNLTIQQDGSCQFSGTYTNRGDTFDSRAPGQDFGACLVVHDVVNNSYIFAYGCWIPSAPQQGSTAEWNFSGKSNIIAENWASIALRNQVSFGAKNNSTNRPFFQDVWNQLSAAIVSCGGEDISGYTLDNAPPNVCFASSCQGLPEAAGGNVPSGHGGGGGPGGLPLGWKPSGDGSSH